MIRTIKKTGEFTKIYKKGRSFHLKSMVIFYLASSSLKVGYVASKKVGNAVSRNRAKRRLRVLFREFSSNLPNGLYILVAKKDIILAPFKLLQKDIKTVIKIIKV